MRKRENLTLKQVKPAQKTGHYEAMTKELGIIVLVRLVPVSRKRCIPIRFRIPFPVYAVYNTADRKSTRLNSSHVRISYAVFCLKKKNKYKFPSASCFGLPHTGVRSIGVAFLAAASAALIDQAAAEGEPGAPDRPVPCLAKRRSD